MIRNSDNDASNFVSGYILTDVTGDNLTDAPDLTINVYNNSVKFVQCDNTAVKFMQCMYYCGIDCGVYVY